MASAAAGAAVAVAAGVDGTRAGGASSDGGVAGAALPPASSDGRGAGAAETGVTKLRRLVVGCHNTPSETSSSRAAGVVVLGTAVVARSVAAVADSAAGPLGTFAEASGEGGQWTPAGRSAAEALAAAAVAALNVGRGPRQARRRGRLRDSRRRLRRSCEVTSPAASSAARRGQR